MFSSKTKKMQDRVLKVFIFAAMCIVATDIYGSIKYNYIDMVKLEIVTLTILMISILFFKYIKFDIKLYMVLSSIIGLTVLSLTVEGYNQSFVLFALAVIPMYSFYFLGTRRGLYWNAMVVILLLLISLNTYVEWVEPLFSIELFLQVILAYIVISYLQYTMEEKKEKYEESLSDMFERRGVLLKELHHRSKNNLHLIMGLLETQAMFTKSKECKELLISQRSRLQAMSLVHENLSGEAKEEKIEMSEYLSKICNYLQNYTEHTIIQNFDKLRLNVEEGMNIGLFFNEALSNAIEHAYARNTLGDIEVTLLNKKEYYVLSIKDYGKGFETNSNHCSLGLTLMEDICGFFPDAFMEFNFTEGTEVRATFQKI